MSLVINIYYKGKNGNAKKFAQKMISSGIVDRIRAEKGNMGYDYFYPINDIETVLLVDKWENKEALDLHHKTDMMKEIAVLREKYDLHMKVEQYTSVDIDKDNERFIRN